MAEIGLKAFFVYFWASGHQGNWWTKKNLDGMTPDEAVRHTWLNGWLPALVGPPSYAKHHGPARPKWLTRLGTM